MRLLVFDQLCQWSTAWSGTRFSLALSVRLSKGLEHVPQTFIFIVSARVDVHSR